ncbi:subtilisin-like protease SBT3.4 [Zingiber officinale]|uniref:subtilisin-like protease SBT3.4 n=1 Tax=Zingiber officinale TaxID=94328 RepID=UPI001C4BAB7E|nr:subtilisin-like protease SBT3.4 [Zingiber officinale]
MQQQQRVVLRQHPNFGLWPAVSLPSFLNAEETDSRQSIYINPLPPATMTMPSFRSLLSVLSLLSLAVLLDPSSLSVSPYAMADATTKLPETEEATVQIVFVEKPETEEPEAFHIRTLVAVLGSEEAAKESLIYHYTHAASGFSAKLTKSQIEELSKQPGVFRVMPSRTLNLMGGSGRSAGAGGFGLARHL